MGPELMKPVPVAPLTVKAHVVREGRKLFSRALADLDATG